MLMYAFSSKWGGKGRPLLGFAKGGGGGGGGGGKGRPLLGFAKEGPKIFKGGPKTFRSRAAAVTGPQQHLAALGLGDSSLYNNPRHASGKSFEINQLHIFYLVRSLKDWTAIFVFCISCSLNSLGGPCRSLIVLCPVNGRLLSLPTNIDVFYAITGECIMCEDEGYCSEASAGYTSLIIAWDPPAPVIGSCHWPLTL